MSTTEESTSIEISATCSPAVKTTENMKKHKSCEEWEINLIGNFLLTLYHRLVIGPQNEWMCLESEIQKEFEHFITSDLDKRLQQEFNGTDNIGFLLQHCGFLLNTSAADSPFLKLKSEALFEFRNKKIKEQDKRRTNHEAGTSSSTGPEDILRNFTEREKFVVLEENYEIDEDLPKHDLQYQGRTLQTRRQNYHATNMSCFICQMDFSTMDGYEEHIQIHNIEKEFEYLKELSEFDSPIFSVSYRLCKNSHHFCFTIETQSNNLVIEKIIIVQSRSMFYVHNMRVPYAMPTNGCDNFYVDSHLFAMFVEQPIILICHQKDNKDTRIIEEHHFMRVLEFPKVNFAIKPYRLPANKIFKTKFKLPEYFPTLEIREALKDDFMLDKLMQTSCEFRDYVQNDKRLQPATVGPTLTTLVQIEDMDTIKDYLNLVQYNVMLRSFGDDYSMRLNPKRRLHSESILSPFDDVIITTRRNVKTDSESLANLILQNIENNKLTDTYLGHIEDISAGRVSFKCYKKLDIHTTYTIIFRPSRLQLRYQYRAMELLPVVMPFLEKFLFPQQVAPRPASTLSLDLYNKSIYTNPDQLQAVRNIAEGPRNDATYIIFGPPGTGKTTTLVESILQVLKRDGTKILVTASSNSACDEVALRLCKALGSIDIPRAIVRIYARSNEARIDTIDDLLLEHSNMYNGQFYPDIQVLHEYRIVVCTMAVVAKLSTGKFGRRENGRAMYSHVFIDEVAASTEVEALTAITTMLTFESCLIIAGDHKQLGPIIKSKRAQELNLDQSLMDRLLARECYGVNSETGDYDRTIQSRLRQNFRSHPAIVNLYSGLYYNHELEAKAKMDDVSLVKLWHLAPSKDFPIIFHSIDGRTNSDNQSFSLYNSDEINVVMDYVKDLMYFGINGKPVRECSIGVISPYKRQYQRIREELNLRKWYQIETGSVETFQGKEKDIIVVSFVRSGTSTLGFLESPRRLNVTVSRAKSLLILIGNAKTLSMNPDYDHIIKECERHNTLIDDRNGKQTSLSAIVERESVFNRFNSSNVMGSSTMDMVNQTLRNNNETLSNAKNRSRRRRRGRGGKVKKSNNANNIEDTNKPSTSKSIQSQATMKMNVGKISKSYRKKNQKTSATGLPQKQQLQRQQLLQTLIRKLNTQIFSTAATDQPVDSPTANKGTENEKNTNIEAVVSKKSRRRLRFYTMSYYAKGKKTKTNKSSTAKVASNAKKNPTQNQAVSRESTTKDSKKTNTMLKEAIALPRSSSHTIPKATPCKVNTPGKLPQQQKQPTNTPNLAIKSPKAITKLNTPGKLPQQQKQTTNTPNLAIKSSQTIPKLNTPGKLPQQQKQKSPQLVPKASPSKVNTPAKLPQQQLTKNNTNLTTKSLQSISKAALKENTPGKLPQQQIKITSQTIQKAPLKLSTPGKQLPQQQKQRNNAPNLATKSIPKASPSKAKTLGKLPQQLQQIKNPPNNAPNLATKSIPKASPSKAKTLGKLPQQIQQIKNPPNLATKSLQSNPKATTSTLPQQKQTSATKTKKVTEHTLAKVSSSYWEWVDYSQ